ncbi:MAG TPA: 30S ribosomal protein S6 [Bacillota bacterium]|nr:30S ribosomal protein S6 [Bacillota bacterium]HOH10844.1 30S ribosomal protein S6 [Bacillota bacterium]HOY88632.1 30S ribosomal protein S6 [Bacillota bacterium]HPI00789.1 30S ribosomal protein S6 [Bacillota bacterium]HPM63972.1 30S ribosomal protein S6 [Bacillota bacterium]
MRAYECMFIISPQLDEENTEAVIAKFDKLITDQGGEVTKTDRMGRRRLAYEIDGNMEGYYTILYFNAEPTLVAELDRVFLITEGVIRHLIVRKDG